MRSRRFVGVGCSMSRNLRTHYDNLQVSRTASADVIKAAYGSLSKKYHPDRNVGDTNSARIIRIVNAAYAVLCDPEQRRKHDAWIAASEAKASENEATASKPSSESARGFNAQEVASSIWRRGVSNRRLRTALLLTFIASISAFSLYSANKSPEGSGLPPYQQNSWQSEPPSNGKDALQAPEPGQRETTVPTKSQNTPQPTQSVAQAPNGSPWPLSAGYVAGYPILRRTGHSKVNIDNSGNSDDVFIKLALISGGKPMPVRQAFIPKYQSFEMISLSPGEYDVRYMNLDDGSRFRTEQFELKQEESEKGIVFNTITMTLFKVPYGNMKTYPLSASEF